MTLLDLKGLLLEARQRIPPVLEMLEDPRRDINNNNADGGAAGGCSFCGGLGHTIVDCPKIEKDAKRIQRGHHDALQMGGGDW
jgi:ATP-dependent RNA helicase DDX41